METGGGLRQWLVAEGVPEQHLDAYEGLFGKLKRISAGGVITVSHIDEAVGRAERDGASAKQLQNVRQLGAMFVRYEAAQVPASPLVTSYHPDSLPPLDFESNAGTPVKIPKTPLPRGVGVAPTGAVGFATSAHTFDEDEWQGDALELDTSGLPQQAQSLYEPSPRGSALSVPDKLGSSLEPQSSGPEATTPEDDVVPEIFGNAALQAAIPSSEARPRKAAGPVPFFSSKDDGPAPRLANPAGPLHPLGKCPACGGELELDLGVRVRAGAWAAAGLIGFVMAVALGCLGASALWSVGVGIAMGAGTLLIQYRCIACAASTERVSVEQRRTLGRRRLQQAAASAVLSILGLVLVGVWVKVSKEPPPVESSGNRGVAIKNPYEANLDALDKVREETARIQGKLEERNQVPDQEPEE